MRQYKILLVDDEPDFLKLTKIRLEAHKYKVVTANSGKESLGLAKKLLPDIIIMDIMMPELDGIATILKLKSAKETKAIPIIVCTGVGGNEDEIVAKNLGAADYIKKPLDDESLITKIERILDK